MPRLASSIASRRSCQTLDIMIESQRACPNCSTKLSLWHGSSIYDFECPNCNAGLRRDPRLRLSDIVVTTIFIFLMNTALRLDFLLGMIAAFIFSAIYLFIMFLVSRSDKFKIIYPPINPNKNLKSTSSTSGGPAT